MKPAFFAFVVIVSTSPLLAQEVKNTSYIMSTGDRVLRLESVVPVGRAEAWKLFTSVEGLKKWIAPVVSIDLKVGGQILTNYDSTKSVTERGTIRLPMINLLEPELITLKVILNEHFTRKVRREDKNLQEIIQLVDLGNGQTKIISSMIGWGKGPEWDKTYDFFARGNDWTYRNLIKLFQ